MLSKRKSSGFGVQIVRRQARSWSVRRRALFDAARTRATGARTLRIAPVCVGCGGRDFIEDVGNRVCAACGCVVDGGNVTDDYFTDHHATAASHGYHRIAYWNSLLRRICDEDPGLSAVGDPPVDYLTPLCDAVRASWSIERRGVPPVIIITRTCRALGEPYVHFQKFWRQVAYAFGAPKPSWEQFQRWVCILERMNPPLMRAFFEIRQRYEIRSFPSLPFVFAIILPGAARFLPAQKPYTKMPTHKKRMVQAWNLIVEAADGVGDEYLVPLDDPQQTLITEFL